MIKRAKVSLASVISFKQASSKVLDYSSKLDKGIACLEELLEVMNEDETVLSDNIASMSESRESVQEVIQEVEEKLSILMSKLEELETELAELQSELDNTESTIYITNEEGEDISFPNPAYYEILARISSVESTISILQGEISVQQIRLDRANNLLVRLDTHIDKENATIYSISEKKNSCKQLIADLNELKNDNIKTSSYAKDDLSKISRIIEDYLKIKMDYGSIDSLSSNPKNSINITININTSEKVSETNSENAVREYSSEEIEEHQISFGEDKRVTEYDGLSFGGKYHPYEKRLERTPSSDNPVKGSYEGVRGESKYIPSDRTVAGINAIRALQKYDLDGIEYRNAEPDFDPCTEVTVRIDHMTENRDDYRNEFGEQCPGNFTQADEECAKLWNFDEKGGRADWTPDDIYNYRKANGLTWHEKCDTITMQMIPWIINDYFKHLGGCAECKVRDGKNIEGDGFDD